MTGEEIVKIAKGLRTDFKCESDIMVDFCNSIIKELENNLRVDCVSRQAVVDMTGLSEWFDSSDSYNEFVIALSELPPVIPQEPMVEIDLYSVIKQSYIEREVLDKIRAEIIELRSKQNVGVLECLDIIDKYKAESEDTEMITFSESQQKIVDALEAVNSAHWIDNHNGTISCSSCHTWFHKDDRYPYMHYCPNCGADMREVKE